MVVVILKISYRLGVFCIIGFMVEHKGQVMDKLWVNEYTVLVRFRVEDDFEFRAGQFIMVKVGDGVYRAYSIASDPGEEFVEVVVDTTPGGPGSQWAKGVKKSDEVVFRGPFGHFGLRESGEGDIKFRFFIATGTGVAPIRSMLHLAKGDEKMKYALIWGLRYKKDVYFNEEWQRLKLEWVNFDYVYCLSREKKGGDHYFYGRVTDYVEQNIDKIRALESEFYVCGRIEMVDNIRQILEDKGVQSERVVWEKYG